MRAARDVEHGLQRIERAGADVAEHHAERRQAQCLQIRVSCSGGRHVAGYVRHGILSPTVAGAVFAVKTRTPCENQPCVFTSRAASTPNANWLSPRTWLSLTQDFIPARKLLLMNNHPALQANQSALLKRCTSPSGKLCVRSRVRRQSCVLNEAATLTYCV